MLVRIEHVQLAMPEGGEDRARAFFCQALGMQEVVKPATLAGRGGCWFKNGEVNLHVGVQDDFTPARKAHPAFVVKHLSALRDRLKQHGISCQDEAPLPGFTRCFVADPFGNRIELMEEHL